MKKIIAFFLVLCLAASVLCACQSGGEPASSNADTNSASAGDNSSSAGDNSSSAGDNSADAADDELAANDTQNSNLFSQELKAEKVGSISIDSTNVQYYDSGICYHSNDKYGIISPDGSSDTGLKYAYCKEADSSYPGYFIVCTNKPGDNEMNSFGVVDNKGTELIPEKYATIKFLSDRFVNVTAVTKKVDSKDEALVFQSDNQFAIFASDDDTFYAGKWEIYDLKTGKTISGISGTKPPSMHAKGTFIEYTDDDQNDVLINSEGTKITDGRTVYENGTYSLLDGNERVIYSFDGSKLFSFDDGELSISESIGDNYYKVYTYKDDETKYYIIDNKGEPVTDKYDNIYDACDGVLATSDSIYSFDGKLISNSAGSSITQDEVFKDAFYAKKDNTYVVFDAAGTVIYSDTSGSLEHSQFDTYKDESPSDKHYSYVTKDFVGDGSTIANWLLQKKSGESKYVLVDLRSGNTLITDPNYDYEAVSDKYNNCYYVYAIPEMGSYSDITVYKITK